MNYESRKPKVLFLDLETDNLDVNKAKIKFVGMMDESGQETMFEWNKDNRQMFLDTINQYDKIVTFNGEAYDLPILKNHGIDIPHWCAIDLYVIYKKKAGLIRSGGFKSYSLKNLVKEIGVETDGKGTIDYHIFMKDEWTPEEYTEIYKYLKQDLVVTKQLWDYLIKKFDNLKEFISDKDKFNFKHITSSSGAYAYMAICHELGIEVEYGNEEGNIPYEGAIVLQPLHDKINGEILYLDFASLYPQMYVHANLFASKCSCCTKEEKWHGNDMFKVDGYYCQKKQGKIEEVIKRFYLNRKAYKKAGDKREFALKIILNTLYGISAKPSFKQLYDPYTASDCTSLARQCITYAIKTLNDAGFEVVAGDSVDGKTKIMIKKDNKIYEEDIEKLYTNTMMSLSGKEYDYIKGVEVLSLDEKGNSLFQPIKYIMRHKTNKKMYRVHFTNNWSIDVTEDHSLMGYQNLAFNNTKSHIQNPLNRIIEIKPEEIGSKASTIISLKKIPLINTSSKNYNKLIYEFMGYFIGDGSFNRKIAHNTDHCLNIASGEDSEEVIHKLILPLIEKGYITSYHLSKSRKGDIKVYGLKLSNIISENCRNNDGKKIIPKWLFDENEENISSFLRGIFSADGSVIIRAGNPIIKVTSIRDDYINEIRKLLYRVGISNSVFKDNTINTYKMKDKIYSSGSYSKNITIQNKEGFIKNIGFILNRKNKNMKIKTGKSTRKQSIENFEFDTQAVKKIELISTPEYVYDIEVEDTHRFFANNVLVHNTDSCFVDLKGKSRQECLDLATKISKDLSNAFPFPWEEFNFKLEDDLIYLQYFRDKSGELKKKNYIYITKDGKMTIKGLDIIKKNCSDLGLKIFDEYLKKQILERKDCVFEKKYIDELIKSAVLKNKMIISKSFNIKDYEEYTSKTSIYNLIKEKYGTGEIKLIKNRKIGAGKGVKYCSIEEAEQLQISDLDLEDVYKELSPFIKDYHKIKAEEKLQKKLLKKLPIIDKNQTKLFN